MIGLIGLLGLAALWVMSRFVYMPDDGEVSQLRLGQLIAELKAQEEQDRIMDEKAREEPARYPHRFAASLDVRVRFASNAELARKEQEKTTLQFLRGGKG